MKIAVLLTTYNRRQKTLSCLEQLFRQKLPLNTSLEVFLTDDASKDGTQEAVKIMFPQVHVFHGTGSLYWAGGMRSTWEHALKSDADYFLLLNDDTILHERAFEILLACKSVTAKPAVCIGSTIDDKGKVSYGGNKLKSKRFWRGYPVHSKNSYVHCDFANGNIMFVPREVVNSIGILSANYTHFLADYDYTLRAKKAGFDVVVAPGFLGSCVDDHGNNWMPQKSTLKQRLVYLKSPKGLAYKEYLKFISYHFPLSYPSAFFKLWLKTFFPFLWQTFK